MSAAVVDNGDSKDDTGGDAAVAASDIGGDAAAGGEATAATDIGGDARTSSSSSSSASPQSPLSDSFSDFFGAIVVVVSDFEGVDLPFALLRHCFRAFEVRCFRDFLELFLPLRRLVLGVR